MTNQTTAVTIDTGLLADIQRFGGADVSACFSCGNCTAICPLSANDGTFPRRMIRYGQVGMKDALLSSKELWTCYHCGRCSQSCPQQADPGGFMAAARRYAIANYDRTRFARALYTRPVLSSVVSVLVAAVLATLLYASHGYESSKSLALFNFIPDRAIHWTGIAVFVVALIAALSGVTMMVRGIACAEGVHLSTILRGRSANLRALRAAWNAVGVESLGQRRYRSDCSEDHEPEPWYRRRSILHEATMWGFLGLLIATMLDYALALTGVKKTGAPVPIWYPVRLLGTVAGVAMVLGVSMLILNRLQHVSVAVKESTQSDWSFLIMLWVIGVSGLALELALYLPNAPVWGYWVFLFHVAVALELILLAPFMKFAHVIYRPVALFFLALASDPVK
jgi:ferredoxin